MVLQATLLKQPNATKVPRPEHPRPDWVRPSKPWHNLNGSWGFAFDDNDRGLDEHWWKWDGRGSGPFTSKYCHCTLNHLMNLLSETITVPYAHQTALSGINDKGVHEVGEYFRCSFYVYSQVCSLVWVHNREAIQTRRKHQDSIALWCGRL